MKFRNIYIFKIVILVLIILGFYNTNIYSQDWFKIDKPNIISGYGFSTHDQSISVKHDSIGNSYHTGYFEGVIVFGKDTLVSNGFRDIYVCKSDSQGNYLWAVSAGGSQSDYGKDIAINKFGEVFVTGYFFGTAFFGNNEITTSGNSDIFVAKLDSSGNWLWVTKAISGGFDRGNSIAVDVKNSYITGYYETSATFGSVTINSTGSKEVFVAKLDSIGNWIWAKSAGGTSSDESFNIKIDKNKQNLIISGYFSSTATFGTSSLVSAGSRDPFVAKIDVNGNWVWAKGVGSSNSDEVIASYIDNNDDIYIGGYYSRSFTIDTLVLTTPSDRDIWLAKLNSNGNWIWAKSLNGLKDDNIYSISGDESSVYISGSFEQNLGSSPNTINATSGKNAFFAKYDKNGNLLFLKSINGNTNVDALSISINNKKVIIVGTFLDKLYAQTDTITTMGDTDIFILNSDSLGNITKVVSNYGVTGIANLMSAEVDKNKDIVLCGFYYGKIIIGNDTLSSKGKKDAFIAKYSYENGFLWSKSFGSSEDDELKTIAIDSTNNYYFGGNFSNNIMIGSQSYSNSGFKDILILKTDSNSNIVFVKTYGSSENDDCNSITVIQNNIAVTGTFIDKINFGATQLTTGSSEEIFVISLTQSGNINWAKSAGGSFFDSPSRIVTGNNNLYLCGSFEENATFGGISLVSKGGDDMFVAKLSNTGNWIWAKSVGSDFYLESAKSLIFFNNHLYFIGNYRALLEIDSNYVLNNGGNDIFVGKLNDSGNWIWEQGVGGSSSDMPSSISIFENKLFISGSFTDIINIGNKTYKNLGKTSSFVVSLDLNGNVIESFAEKSSLSSSPINLLFLKNKNFVLAGNYQGNLSFGNISIAEKWSANKNIFIALNGIEPIKNKWTIIANTGRSSEIILPKSINPKVGNLPIAVGDAVGVFYIRNSNHYCAGYGIWNNQDLAITVWGDNISTLVKDGMADNENYLVKAWSSTLGEEWETKVRYSSGPSYFVNNTQSIISHFPFYYDTLKINLNLGWNFISSNVLPYNLNLDTIFKNYTNDILILKNSKGQSYIPSYGINTIGNWNIHQGYQVYALQSKQIQIIGEYVVPEQEMIKFSTGWSLLAYLRKDPINIEDALSSISDKGKLLIVKNSLGQAFIPSYSINTIGNIIPGRGYQIYFTAPDTLIYPPNAVSKSLSKSINNYATNYLPFYEFNNPNNSTLLVNSNSLYDDYEIGVYNTYNNLIGAGKINNGRSIITIYGNEETSSINNFVNNGEQIILKLLNNDGKVIKEFTPILRNIFNKETSYYDNNQIYQLNLGEYIENNLTISPNPATDYINITTNENDSNFYYEIFDLNNNILLNGKSKTVKINSLPNGVHFIKITIGQKTYLKNFVKVN